MVKPFSGVSFPALLSLLHEPHLSPPTQASGSLHPPARGNSFLPYQGPQAEERGTPIQGSCLRCPAPGQRPQGLGRQCSYSLISRGVVGEELVWVGIADLCPLGSPAAQSPTAADPLQQAYAGVQQYAGR